MPKNSKRNRHTGRINAVKLRGMDQYLAKGRSVRDGTQYVRGKDGVVYRMRGEE